MPSEPTGFFAIVNHERFQHYKDRNPPWIKLHASTLDDYAFVRLPDAQKWHLVGLWILASKMENRLPLDEAWLAAKIGAGPDFAVQPLIDAGFVTLARRKQDASRPQAKRSPRQRRDREEKRERASNWVATFGDAWKAKRGMPSYPRIGKALAEIVAAHGTRQVLAAWNGYLVERDGKPFATPEDFAANYRIHRDKYAQVANAAGDGWEPIPDEPEAAA